MSVTVNTTSGTQVSVSVNGTNVVSFLTEETSVNVTDGDAVSITVSEKGPKGDAGETGAAGAGFSQGGAENQFIQKNSAADYDTKWSAYTLPATDGDDGQVLTTNGAATVTFAYPKTIAEDVKNVSGGPLVKGTPVHVTGSVGNLAEVIAADAATNYPAHFVLNQDLADEEEGLGIAIGFINNVDVPDASIYTEGQTVYLGESGGWTTTKPTGANAIQNLGIIIKVNTSGNKISGIVMGAGRANDVPNIATGNIWAGNADGVATATSVAYIDIANERVGIGTTTPSYPLDVDGGTENNVASFASTDAVAQLRVIDYSLVPFYFGVNGTNAYISPTGGTPAGGLAVTSTGRVGIGTASPTSKLEVNGGVTASGPIDSSDATNTSITSETARFNKFGLMTNRSSLYITNYNASGSMQFGIGGVHAANTKMYLSSAGRLGVGTTSPSEKLEVAGNVILDSSDARIKIKGGVTGTNSGIDWTFNTDSTQYARMELDYDTRNTTGLLIDSGYPMTLDYSSGAFSVKKNGTSELTVLNGNVGIGTTSPAHKLDVVGGAKIGGTLFVEAANNQVRLVDSDSSGNFSVGVNTHFQIRDVAGNTTPVTIQSGTPGGTLFLKSDGNIGIGTTSPSAKLDVVGLANINDGSNNVMISSGNTALTTGSGNTAVGYLAGDSNTEGSDNSFVGINAGRSNTTGSDNSLVGRNAGYSNTSGSSNSFVGRNAGFSNTGGGGNSFVGLNAGYYSTGNSNVLIGREAGYGSATSAYSNTVAVGYQALKDLTTGAQNTAVGYRALTNITTQNDNTAVGYQAGYANASGGANSFFGTYAGYSNTGSSNTAVGYAANFNNSTGNYNVAIGRSAALGVSGASTFSNTVAVGYSALTALTTGASNTGVGYRALASNLTGDNNTAVGNAAGVNITSSNNTVMGFAAGQDITSNSNTAIGWRAGEDNGDANTALGRDAARFTTGNNNVAIGFAAAKGVEGVSNFNSTIAIGYQALTALTANIGNVAIGYQSGYSLTTGQQNVMLGYKAGYNETGSNKLYIANSDTTTPLIYGEFDNEILNVNGKLKPNSITVDDEGLSAAGDYGPGAEIWYQGTSTPSAGFCYYLDSTGGWTSAQANAAGTATGMLAVSAGTDSDVDGMVLRGFVQISNTLTGSVGDAVYLETSAAGRFTTTKPTGAGNFVRRVGYLAKGTNVIYFNPSPEWEAL